MANCQNLGVHLLYLASASFLSWVHFPPLGTVPTQLSYYQGERVCEDREHQLVALPDKQARARCHVPASLPVPRPVGRAQASVPPPSSGLNPSTLLLCLWQESPLTSHGDTFYSSLDLLPFFSSLLPFLSGFILLLLNPLLPGLVCWPLGHCRSMASYRHPGRALARQHVASLFSPWALQQHF